MGVARAGSEAADKKAIADYGVKLSSEEAAGFFPQYLKPGIKYDSQAKSPG